MQDKLVRIGVFYDGHYFLQVSNYYAYGHARRRRISIQGLHQFILNRVATEEAVELRHCKVIEAHYYRGRLSAGDASQKGDTLYYDRVFDDILMSEGVTPHYTTLKMTPDGYRQEKGIDVWLALDAYELSLYKKFSVVVLIASDGDYVPLVRKLNSLGIRVMVLGWDFEYTTDMGGRHSTRTSQQLLQEASYGISMAQVIDDRFADRNYLVNNLFVQVNEQRRAQQEHQQERRQPVDGAGFHAANGRYVSNEQDAADVEGDEGEENEELQPGNSLDEGDRHESEIFSLKSGFGFIRFPPNNLFFHYTSIQNADFNELQVGDKVVFSISQNERGEDIAKNVALIYPNQDY